MSGYAYCLGPCIVCHQPFWFNPHAVPSTSIITGAREPVCLNCMTVLNGKRKAAGLEPFPILPGAYKPIPEEEL